MLLHIDIFLALDEPVVGFQVLGCTSAVLQAPGFLLTWIPREAVGAGKAPPDTHGYAEAS